MKYNFYTLLQKNFIRFLISGGLNTTLTYGIYLFLLYFLDYKSSYTISYISGVIIAYLMNRFFVFKTHKGIRSVLLLPVIYLAQYLMSILILWYWIENLHFSEMLAPLIVIVITVPINYLLSKSIFLKATTQLNERHKAK